jgi:hypothetical protein
MIVSAYDENPWRVERVKKALKYFCAIVSITPEQADLQIESMEDFKGGLHVKWKNRTSKYYMISMDKAWRLCKEKDVIHLGYRFGVRLDAVDYDWEDGDPDYVLELIAEKLAVEKKQDDESPI